MEKNHLSIATSLVDKAISEISSRNLVSSSEMTDLLLDIRLEIMLFQEINLSNV